MKLFQLVCEIDSEEKALDFYENNILHQTQLCISGHEMELQLIGKNDSWRCNEKEEVADVEQS